MIRIRRSLEIFQVTADTRRARQVVVVAGVAVGALARRYSVPTAQRESDGIMIKARIQPRFSSVASRAVAREPGLNMVRVAGGLEFLRVARVALCRHCLEAACGCAFVAGIAINSRMRSRQRKAVVVLLYLLDRDLPSAHRVALLAIGTELALVDVGMAILAALPHIRENKFYVALRAGN